jgi:erythritol transport system permease protein
MNVQPQSWLLLLLRLRTFVALILVFGYFAAYAPNFLSAGNMIIVTKHVALNAFLAIGMTFVIITGGIDLSVGSTVGLSAMVAGWLVLYGIDPGLGWSIQFNTVEIALLTCLANGLLITRAGVAPCIATLGSMYIARGAALLSSEGRTFPNLNGVAEYGSDTFAWIGTGTVLGIPFLIWLLAGAAYAARRCRASGSRRSRWRSMCFPAFAPRLSG